MKNKHHKPKPRFTVEPTTIFTAFIVFSVAALITIQIGIR